MEIQPQPINVGLQANDGSGDSIRNSFIKINENFSTVFTEVNTLSETVQKTTLSSLYDGTTYNENQVIMGNNDGNKLSSRTLSAEGSLEIDATNDNVLVLNVTSRTISDDISPHLITHFNAKKFAIGNLSDPSIELVNLYNSRWSNDKITIDSLPVTVGYANANYLAVSPDGDIVVNKATVTDATIETATVTDATIETATVSVELIVDEIKSSEETKSVTISSDVIIDGNIEVTAATIEIATVTDELIVDEIKSSEQTKSVTISSNVSIDGNIEVKDATIETATVTEELIVDDIKSRTLNQPVTISSDVIIDGNLTVANGTIVGSIPEYLGLMIALS